MYTIYLNKRFVRWSLYQIRLELEKHNWSKEEIVTALGGVWMLRGVCPKMLVPGTKYCNKIYIRVCLKLIKLGLQKCVGHCLYAKSFKI